MAVDFRRWTKWFAWAAIYGVAASGGLVMVWVGGWLLWRVICQVQGGSADEVNKLLLGLAGLLGAPFLVWRTWIADRQRYIAQEELYTGLLVKAVEQLGATREEKTADGSKTVPNTEVRLGAIYALEKLAADYLPLHWQIMEILCAYVRKNAGEAKPCSEEIKQIYAKPANRTSQEIQALFDRRAKMGAPPIDVQAALTVIGRRSKEQRELERKNRLASVGNAESCLDFSGCHLARATLKGGHFERARFIGTCLEGAVLVEASLEGAMFLGAHLQDANALGRISKGCISTSHTWMELGLVEHVSKALSF